MAARDYIGDLYDHVVADRDSIRTLLALSYDPDAETLVAVARQRFHGVLDELTEVARHWAGDAGLVIPRMAVRVRATFAMIVAIGLYDAWFLTPDAGLDRDTIVGGLADVVRHGAVAGRRPG